MWKNLDFHRVGVFTFFPSWVHGGTPLQTLTVLYTSHMSLSKQMPSLPPKERQVLCWTDKLQTASSESFSLTSFVSCCQMHFSNEAPCVMEENCRKKKKKISVPEQCHPKEKILGMWAGNSILNWHSISFSVPIIRRNTIVFKMQFTGNWKVSSHIEINLRFLFFFYLL